MKFEIGPDDCLLIIDPQNDFCPGGALAVTGGDEIMGSISELAQRFSLGGAHVVTTQDWHPAQHSSFASEHAMEPFTETNLDYGKQTLWPDHCVQGTRGAEFHKDVLPAIIASTAIIRKGYHKGVDSYSAFLENDKVTTTGLDGLLSEHGIMRVFVVGLAYDFCVGYSAIDAAQAGFKAVVIKDLTRAIAMPIPPSMIMPYPDTTTVHLIESEFGVAGVIVANQNEIGFPK